MQRSFPMQSLSTSQPSSGSLMSMPSGGGPKDPRKLHELITKKPHKKSELRVNFFISVVDGGPLMLIISHLNRGL